jgi:hypothetical protein
MSVDPAAMLRALGSGVRPAGVDAVHPVRSADGPSFQQMLEDAASGGISSGLPVRVSRNVGVDLSPAQLSRLARAADRAEAAGVERAVVLIDGQALQMDVGLRTVTGKADLNATSVLTGVDAVVTVAPDAGELPGQPPRLAPSLMNASLLKLLGGRTPPQA